MTIQPRVATGLWFDGDAEEAANLYISLLPDSRIMGVTRNSPEGPALPELKTASSTMETSGPSSPDLGELRRKLRGARAPRQGCGAPRRAFGE